MRDNTQYVWVISVNSSVFPEMEKHPSAKWCNKTCWMRCKHIQLSRNFLYTKILFKCPVHLILALKYYNPFNALLNRLLPWGITRNAGIDSLFFFFSFHPFPNKWDLSQVLHHSNITCILQLVVNIGKKENFKIIIIKIKNPNAIKKKKQQKKLVLKNKYYNCSSWNNSNFFYQLFLSDY